jgi:hypothetical protein
MLDDGCGVETDEAGESWMPFMPVDRVLLNATRPNGAEQSGDNEEDATDEKHGIMANVLDELHRSNENEISDGWRGGAWRRVDVGISWKMRNRGCQTFAASHG